MRTNAWARITDTLAQTWRTWALWARGGRTGPEPPLHPFAKGMLQHAVDLPFTFNAYKTATVDSVEWRLGSVYDVTKNQLQEGYAVYPDEWKVVGLWTWEPGGALCVLDPEYPFDASEALLFMPDRCVDPPECTDMVPATEVRDVSLLAGQPPREFPVTSVLVS